MGWIIIAIGAVCAAFGGWVAYSGFEIVQVERGWSAVIAGTTLMSAGIITLGVGLMTLKLTSLAKRLRFSVLQAEGAKPWVKPVNPVVESPIDVAAPASTHKTDAEVPLAVNAPVEAEVPVVEEPVARTHAPVIAAGAVAAVAGVALAAEEGLFSAPEHKPEAVKHEPITLATNRFEAELAKLNQPVAVKTPEQPQAVLESIKPLEAAAPAPEVPETPAWLVPSKPEAPDTASLSSMDQQLNELHSHAAHDLDEAEVTTPDPAEHLDAAGRYDSAAAESFSDLVAEPQELAEPVTLPIVVGRYEAAGTNYAMYSDGSVEAENEHGIFRFASMAELRTFIEEGQMEEAQNQAAPVT